MIETEKKALALVNEVEGGNWLPHETDRIRNFATICRAIEQHEAYKLEVSNEMLEYTKWCKSVGLQFPLLLERFIIAKPDEATAGLALAVEETLELVIGDEDAKRLRAAIEARGGRIVWEAIEQ